MSIKDFLSMFWLEYKQIQLMKNLPKNEDYKERRMASLIIKSCHSIEKGLSLKEPRPGFGEQKIENILSLIEGYQRCGYDMNHLSIKMAFGVLKEYMTYQQSVCQINSGLESKIDKLLQKNCFNTNEKTGGTRHINKIEVTQINKDEFERVVFTRHSLRNYSDEEVCVEALKEAVRFALQAPSACNRQPSRVYIIDKSQRDTIIQYLRGVGGFENSADKYLIVTSDISAYSLEETNQWIVSTGIFVGYLSLALHACGIGACIVQRQLQATKENKRFAEYFNIPEEEQIICVVCVGKYPEEFNVPVSIRYKVEDIINERK